MTRIAILDGRGIWAAGASSIVEAVGFELVGSWPDFQAAMPSLVDSPPDVLILSAALVDPFSVSKIGEIEQRPSIILVMEPGHSLPWARLGDFQFEGLLFRDTPTREAANCLKSVADGHAWIDPNVLRSAEGYKDSQTDWACLTARELEVANLATRGLSNKRIAKILDVSDGTVKMHMHHILNKLHLGRRAGLNGAVPGSGAQSSFGTSVIAPTNCSD